MKWTLLTLFLVGPLIGYSQVNTNVKSLNWTSSQAESSNPAFDNCDYKRVNGIILPVYFDRYEVTNAAFKAEIFNTKYEKVDLPIEWRNIKDALGQPPITSNTSLEAGKTYLNVEVLPFRFNQNSGSFEKLISFEIRLVQDVNQQNRSLYKKAGFTTSSVLGVGDWHKLQIPKEGIYKIEVADLVAMNIDPTTVDANTYQLMGSEGGILPEIIDEDRTDDLAELAIQVVDNNQNNRLDGSDHILFYAEGPHVWRFNEGMNQYIHENNFYDSYNYVLLTHSQTNGKRVTTTASGQGNNFDTTLNSYHRLLLHEVDERSFINSGREWFGESFGKNTSQTFSHTFGNARIGDSAIFRQRFTGRSIQVPSSYSVKINGDLWHSETINPVGGEYDQDFIDDPSLVNKGFKVNSSTVNLEYSFFPGSTTADAWLDYYELAMPVNMVFSTSQAALYADKTSKFSSVRFEMETNGNMVWNTSDYFNAHVQNMFVEGTKDYAVINSGNTRLKFQVFSSASALKANYVGKVQNQNLHALKDIEYAIVTHPDFMAEANRLADFHRSYYGYSVAVVSTTQIYNEFGGGGKDATAIRDFFRMLYERGQSSTLPFRFALLFGDGTYDFKNRIDNNTNYILTFQGSNSYDPSYSYGADDYFAILDPGEGYFNVTEAREGMDIGIGRIPCRDEEQASVMVNKIIRYHDPKSFGEWRNRLSFCGDDEDNNQHFNDSEQVSNHINNQNPVYNIDKIYLDAYLQQSFGSGEKYPEVNEAIDRNFEKGHLVFNYLGHGGPSGMAHERIVTRSQIRNWSNTDKLPVIITATCELTRYDDPVQDSPGELMMFDDDGGAIALITTTRLVYINLNRNLNDKILDNNMFDLSQGKPTLGEIFMKGKNASQKNVNQRNFSLIGDPAMVMAYPTLNVVTTHINDSAIGQQAMDTFRAFSKMKISGEVRNPDGSLATNYNGVVYPTMFDKYLTYTTLGNDPSSFVRNYTLQNSVLYRGQVSVTNGKFSFQFVVPKDIAYHNGEGKLVYYTQNHEIDGNGYQTEIVVGGSESNVASDEIGPEVELFMDDFSFVLGGLTAERPLLLCKVYDENGINTVGNGIGRDITAILDEGTENEKILVLNDFYQSKLDSYQEGEIRYNMESLSPGRHTLKIRVWDVYNNASEDYTEFVVASDEDITLGHVLNYPNPFTSNTSFHFDHNKEGQNMDVQIQILSISGTVVKSFHHSSVSSSSHFNEIAWDGRDAFGDRLARGVYLYKLSVKSEDGSEAEAIQKLVLLK